MARSAGPHFIVVFNLIPEMIARVEEVSRAAPKRVADEVVAEAKRLVPVDSGYLKSTITSRSLTAGKEAEVFVGAPYAGYVEYGTYKMAAQPFLNPAFERKAKKLGLELYDTVLI